jgi:hypothetical protein
MPISRRNFNRLLVPGLAGLCGLRPGLVRAAPATSERKFLFVYARGGWDYSYVFAPLFDHSYVDSDPNSTTAESGGLTFVDSEDRPAVRTFFENYADRTCIVNGFEVPSITHPRCAQILFCGKAGLAIDDFPSILAANSKLDLPMPYTVLSGPAYTAEHTSLVVRVGAGGQLPKLLDGSMLAAGTQEFDPLSAGADTIVDRFVERRAAAHAAQATVGRNARFADRYDTVLGRIREVYDLGDPAAIFATEGGGSEVDTALDLLALDLSRCVLIQDNGRYSMSWDTHSNNSEQTFHYQLLFEKLLTIMEGVDARTTLDGRPLQEDLTIVVISEMGRDPRLNGQNGKHHWTWTSAMLIGAGVTGGRVVGGYDEFVMGMPMDRATGEVDESGTQISAADMGATLLALGDVDPGDHLVGADPVLGILS